LEGELAVEVGAEVQVGAVEVLLDLEWESTIQLETCWWQKELMPVQGALAAALLIQSALEEPLVTPLVGPALSGHL
jgi:hypothetical protein